MKKVVLVHGFNKNQNDMIVLKENLEDMGYEGFLVDLPLTYRKIQYSLQIFKENITPILNELDENEKICLVGHSTGGLIIRLFLSDTKYNDKIDRSVLISTPNNGSKLADLASKAPTLYTKIYKTLNSLKTVNIKKMNFRNVDSIEVGAIAGNKNNLLMGKLLKDKNDGRVQVNSVYYKELTDFIIVPYGHKEIHHNYQTAKLVNSFLRNGKFKK